MFIIASAKTKFLSAIYIHRFLKKRTTNFAKTEIFFSSFFANFVASAKEILKPLKNTKSPLFQPSLTKKQHLLLPR
jgi:hypothetical protein